MPVNYKQAMPWQKSLPFLLNKIPLALRNFLPGLLQELIGRCYFQLCNPLILPYLELCITPRCSLHCIECANLMQYYKNPLDYATEDLICDMEKLLAAVDGILMYRILGGEPFLHKGLPRFIEQAASYEKISQVQIVTNGTIIPSDDVVSVLTKNKVSVEISNYGNISKNMGRLIDLFKTNNINFSYCIDYKWNVMGKAIHRHYSKEQLCNIYRSCAEQCKTLVNGELHICPRSAHAAALGIIERIDGEYVDVRQTESSVLRQRIRALYEVDHIEACHICLPSAERHEIPVALQHGEVQK